MRKYLIIATFILAIPTITFVSTRPTTNRHDQSDTREEGAIRSRQPKMTKEEYENQFPIVDYTASPSVKAVIREKESAAQRRYRIGQDSIAEEADTIISHRDWAVGLSALPVDKSQAVILGKVVSERAVLTKDKAIVFSEFVIQIDEIFKDYDNSLAPNSVITATRGGGRVRFPSGHITLQAIAGQNMPRAGKKYTFFLTRENSEEDFHILTAYQFQQGFVIPLDDPSGGTHPIASTYNGAQQELFLKELRTTLATPRPSSKN